MKFDVHSAAWHICHLLVLLHRIEIVYAAKEFPNSNVGIAPHSLRAVNKAALKSAVAHVRSLDAQAPIHIHIAEQQKEVDDCLAHYGKRPVQWLLDNIALDKQPRHIHIIQATDDCSSFTCNKPVWNFHLWKIAYPSSCR